VGTACALSTTRGWFGGRKGAKEKKKGVKNSGGEEKRVFVRRIRIRKDEGTEGKRKERGTGGWEWVVGDDVDTIT